MQQARTTALQGMNARGLTNSSLALGEGEKAAMAAALPIASQDANASLAVKTANQNATNQALQFGAGSENQVGLQKLQGSQSMDLATLQGQTQKDIADIEAQYKQLMQANDSTARFFSQISSSISDILKEPNISVDGKQQLVLQQTNLLKNGIALIAGISKIPELNTLLNFDIPVPNSSGWVSPASASATTAAPVSTPQTEALQILGRLQLQASDGGDSWVDPVTGTNYTRDAYQRLQAQAGG